MTVEEAAEIMEVSLGFIYVGLRQNRLPFGIAIHNKEKDSWTYWISRQKFFDYMQIPDPKKEKDDAKKKKLLQEDQ